jgi:hypothetical protein
MSYIEELETKIMSLPKQDFVQLRNWMLDLDEAHWDRQIANDLKTGKLNHLIANARTEMAVGIAKEL